MSSIPYLKCLLEKLGADDYKVKHLAVKELSKITTHINRSDLKIILHFLMNINDLDVEIELLSLLSIYLKSNDAFYETIVKYDPIYEKLEVILNRRLPLKATVILCFITMLVYFEGRSSGSRRKDLAMKARIQLRVSGCLRAMCALYVSSMMFPDTWKALCQCIAECCHESVINKSQCAHLIQPSINQCRQGHTEAIVVLRSLLQDHQSNIKIFLDANGCQIFTSTTLQYNSCLNLLYTLVQSTKDAITILQKSEISKFLKDILHWSGPDSQKGQWCSIILHHLQVFTENSPNNRKIEPTCNSEMEDGEHNSDSFSLSTTSELINNTWKQGSGPSKQDSDNTACLLRGVMQEMLYLKSQETMAQLPQNIRYNNKFGLDFGERSKKESKPANLRHDKNFMSQQATVNIGYNELDPQTPQNIRQNNKSGLDFGERSKKESNPVNLRHDKNFMRQQATVNIDYNKLKPQTPQNIRQNNKSGLDFGESSKKESNPVNLRHDKNFMRQQATVNIDYNELEPLTPQNIRQNNKSGLYFGGRSNKESNPANLLHEKNFMRRQATMNIDYNEVETLTKNTVSLSFKSHTQINCQKVENKTQNKTKTHVYQNETEKCKEKSVGNFSKERSTFYDKSCQTDCKFATIGIDECRLVDRQSLEFNDFNPIFISTPKTRKQPAMTVRPSHQRKCRAVKVAPRSNTFTENLHSIRRSKISRNPKRPSSPVDLNNRSLSLRLFSAINESCSTLIKSVKNVFTPWKRDRSPTAKSISKIKGKERICSNLSFTNYMRRRDALLEDSTKDSKTSNGNNVRNQNIWKGNNNQENFCKTCDDTGILKQKLQDNDYLKKTVKKLKLGINLYGCDFKKISKTFWSNEPHMTPTVLCNLYRKLILK